MSTHFLIAGRRRAKQHGRRGAGGAPPAKGGHRAIQQPLAGHSPGAPVDAFLPSRGRRRLGAHVTAFQWHADGQARQAPHLIKLHKGAPVTTLPACRCWTRDMADANRQARGAAALLVPPPAALHSLSLQYLLYLSLHPSASFLLSPVSPASLSVLAYFLQSATCWWVGRQGGGTE